MNSFKKIWKKAFERWDTFESVQVICEINKRKSTFIVVHRPLDSRAEVFIDKFRTYLESVDMVSANVFISGNFNLLIENPENSSAMAFIEMDSFNLINKVNESTSLGGHMLDLVFNDIDCDFVQGVC